MTERSLQEIETDLIAKIRAEIAEPLLIDLGCGYTELPEGFIGADLYAKGERIKPVDLFDIGVDACCQMPPYHHRSHWPWADDSVDFFTSSHFVEHVPDWDAHFAEVWRCLKPGGCYRVVAPHANSDRYLQDSTHKQPVLRERLAYLNQNWMRENKLEHGRPPMNFSVVALGYWWHPDFEFKSDTVKEYALTHYRNVANDVFFIVKKEQLLQ